MIPPAYTTDNPLVRDGGHGFTQLDYVSDSKAYAVPAQFANVPNDVPSLRDYCWPPF